MAKTVARSVDLEAIERLEEKLKQLVAAITRLRAEQTRLAEDNGRLMREQARLTGENAMLAKERDRLSDDHAKATRDLEVTRARLAEVEGAQTELSTLKDEREAIRARVTEMLQQLEGLTV